MAATELALLDRVFDLFKDTVLPEFVDILNYDQVVKILDIFGGKHIYIPSWSNLSDILRDCKIYDELSKASPEDFKMTLFSLSEEFELNVSDVKRIFKNEQKSRERKYWRLKDTPEFKEEVAKMVEKLRKSGTFDSSSQKKYRRVR